ncbi:MAG: HAD-IIA family hydrolase [Erysipelotrichaceae bacterium]|nr:HAD-IIA family hydrolase [Erysipelotrichaceae bacterium]
MKKLILLDMDGTIYLGNQLFDGVKECFDYFKKHDIKFVFITNNSSHDLEFYISKVNNMGIKCNEENFYSSIEVTLEYLTKRNAKKIYVLGNECLKKKLRNKFELVSTYSKDIKLDAVVCGFNTELVYEDLKNACLYLETQDVEFVATNGDYRCPIEDGLYIPDCGGMIEWMRLCTNKTAKVLGKPDPEIINQLVNKYQVNKDEVLCIGDRLYTDIKVAVNAGVDSVCVLSGESTLEDIKAYEAKPTYILDSIKDLPELLEKIN